VTAGYGGSEFTLYVSRSHIALSPLRLSALACWNDVGQPTII
jgi:hypothetical protein